jgi:hypothetical protein
LATSDASARVGPRVRDHRLQHLGGDDHRLGVLPGDLDRALLHQRHVLQRQLDAQVAAGDHDAVEREHDGLEVVDRLRLLQLGDHRQPGAPGVHDLVDEVDVRRAAHERQRDHVDPQFEGELQVGDVLLGQRGHRHVHAGQREALVVADRPALGDAADHVHASTAVTRSPTLPSSTSSRSSARASSARPL